MPGQLRAAFVKNTLAAKAPVGVVRIADRLASASGLCLLPRPDYIYIANK